VGEPGDQAPFIRSGLPDGYSPPELEVRPEELAIVAVVLLLWAAAVALFINRWGKIRQMEPYHPYMGVAGGEETAEQAQTSQHRASIFDPRPSLTVLATSPANAQGEDYTLERPEESFPA